MRTLIGWDRGTDDNNIFYKENRTFSVKHMKSSSSLYLEEIKKYSMEIYFELLKYFDIIKEFNNNKIFL